MYSKKQQQLRYLYQMQRIRQLNVLKDDIHLTYQYRNRNKATQNIHRLQDEIQNEIVERTLNGEYPSRAEIKRIQRECNFDSRVENEINTLLVNERKRIHRAESRFIDHAVELHADNYTNFMKNRITLEAERIIEKVIVTEGKAIEDGATPEQARQAVREYARTHGKARTKNMIRDAVHSQECNVSFIQAIENEFRYKVWMNGRSKSGVRAWHVREKIEPVAIDEYFELYGPSGRAEAMYPGDLNSGPENVANCHCWLRYTNHRPKGAGQTVFNVPESSYLNADTRRTTVRIREAVSSIGERVKGTASKLKTKISNIGGSIRNRFKI